MPLSSKQMEYLALAWQCFESEPKIDYEKFKTVAGLKSAASARELMRVTKNKLKEEYGALSGGMKSANNGSTSPVKKGKMNGTPASGKKRARGKKAAAEMEMEGEGDEDDAEEETPVKKKVKGVVKVEETREEENGGGEESEGELF